LLRANLATRKSSAPGRFNITKQTRYNAPPAGTLPDWNASEKNTKLPVSCLDAAKQKRAGCEPPRDFLKSAFD
jgi:hypothetical protein